MDTLEAMRVFVEVARQGSFTTAADQLSLSRSVVSKQVAQLERHFDARLMHRTTRQLRLTEAGQLMLERAEHLLAEVDGLAGTLREDRVASSGRIRLSAPLAFGARCMGELLAEYHARHPAVRIELALSDRRVDLVAEGFDLALRIGELEDSSLIARRLGSLRLILCASPAYLARRGTPGHPRELNRHDGLHYSLARHGQEWRLGEQRVRARSVLQANNGEVLRDAAIAGMGITLQPDFMLREALANGELVTLLDDWPLPTLRLHGVYPDRTQPQRVHRLLDSCEAFFNERRIRPDSDEIML